MNTSERLSFRTRQFCGIRTERYNPAACGFPTTVCPTHALATEIAGLVAVLCLALAGACGTAAQGWYPIKAAGLFALVMLIALGHLRGHHPFAQFGPANQLTTARAGTGRVGRRPDRRIRTAAGRRDRSRSGPRVPRSLDGLDGWLARHAGMASAFGARFDVEVDALLIQALAILAWQLREGRPLGAVLGIDALRFRRRRLAVAVDAAAAHTHPPRTYHLHRANRRARPRDRAGHHAATQHGDRGAWSGRPLLLVPGGHIAALAARRDSTVWRAVEPGALPDV